MSLDSIVKHASDHGPSELSRIDFLDGWRGIAILLVLLSHFLNLHFIHFGRMGVDVFFVLSGMLMSNILFVKKVPLSIFYKRRISRILPVFFVFITILCLFSFFFDLSNEHNNYLYNLLFLRSYFPENPHLWETGLPNGHLWSLNVEEHAYIILSLVTLVPVLVKRAYLPILMLGFGSIIVQIIYVKMPDFAPANYNLRTEVVVSFLMISAGYFLIKDKFEKYVPSWAPLLSLALATLCYSPYTPHWAAQWAIAPFLLAFTVNHLNLIPDLFKTALSLQPLRLIGLWSFSIYLWQQPLYFYGVKFGEAFKFAGPILFIVAIFVGAFSFYLIENPIRMYLNKKW